VRRLASRRLNSAQKIDLVMRNLSFIKAKGARDLLTTGFGLVTDRIALDTRVIGSLSHIGIEVSDRVRSSPEAYDHVERQLVRELCMPMKLLPAQLDQLLFYRFKEIRARKW
jgi:thermostable 8-oxoguanine DNA glycosylase